MPRSTPRVPEDGDLRVHCLPQPLRISDTRREPFGRPTTSAILLSSRRIAWDGAADSALRALGGIDSGAPAEDQGVEQGVGAQPVSAVHRYARDLAGRVEAGNVRASSASVFTPPIV